MAVGVRSAGAKRGIAPLRVARMMATRRIVMSNPENKYPFAIIYIVRSFGVQIKMQNCFGVLNKK
jgi:hypothetical protein